MRHSPKPLMLALLSITLTLTVAAIDLSKFHFKSTSYAAASPARLEAVNNSRRQDFARKIALHRPIFGLASLADLQTQDNPIIAFGPCAAPSLGMAANIPLEFPPLALAVGDFNSDGKADLAVITDNSNTVSLLLGDGKGGFGAAANFSLGANPRTIAAGDFNADGKADLVVAIQAENKISVHLGNGAGGFSPAPDFAVGLGPVSIAVGDFNGDQRPDLAVANLASNNVSLLLADDQGGFGPATNLSLESSPQSVAAGDFNGDNRLDLAVITSANLLSIWFGDGRGGFGARNDSTLGATAHSLAAGDFNGDNKLDLAVTNLADNNVSVLLGNGEGGFGTPANFDVGTAPASVVAGDFNGDGKPDLAIGNSASNNISILLNTCTRAADLALSKSHSGAFTVGANGSYTLTVTNVGTAATTDLITVTDTLPSELSYVSATGAGWNCSASGQTVTCTYNEPLAVGAVGASIALTVSVSSAAMPSVTNTASVSTSGEINPTNNTANDLATVSKPKPTIKWNNPADIAYGTALSSVQLNATASFNEVVVPGTFNYAPPEGTVLNPGSGQTLGVIFTPTDTASFDSNTASVQINVLCSYSISPETDAFGKEGGNGAVVVTTIPTENGCNWTSVSNAPWITITAGSSGSGSGTVSYQVAANNDAPRSGTLNIAGRTITIKQGGTCSYFISPPTNPYQLFSKNEDSNSVNVVTSPKCSWTVSNNASWINPLTGLLTGSGIFEYKVLANATNNQRSAALTITGQGEDGETFLGPNVSVLQTITNAVSQGTSSTGPPRLSIFLYSGIPSLQITPTVLGVLQSYEVSINVGLTLPGPIDGLELVSQNPMGNPTWGIESIPLSSARPPDSNFANHTFKFTITAPSTPGIYNFQWRMNSRLRGDAAFLAVTPEGTAEGINDFTPNIAIRVTATTFSIGGRITDSNGEAVSGVLVELSGSQPRTTTTDSSGRYSFAKLPEGGSYTVTPRKPGSVFDRSSRPFFNLSGDRTANFTAMQTSQSISGRILTGSGEPLTGITVTLSSSQAGAPVMDTTDSQGNYSFSNLTAGIEYQVTPLSAIYAFNSQSILFSALGENKTRDFTATLKTFSINGRLTDSSGKAIPGVTMILRGPQVNLPLGMTDSQGNYSFSNLTAGNNYLVATSSAIYDFSPSSISFFGLSKDETGDFTATRRTVSLSGQVTDNSGVALPGVTVSLRSPQIGSDIIRTTDSSGNYSFTALPAGNDYTVTPSIQLYDFSPLKNTFSVLTTNQTANFIATRKLFSISGKVTIDNSVGVSAVTVTAVGGGMNSPPVTIDSQGNYMISSLPAGIDYTVTPSMPSRDIYTFSSIPSVGILLADRTSVDFTATRKLFSIKGKVTINNSVGASALTITATSTSINSPSVTIDSQGNYMISNLPAGISYTVKPSSPFHTFSPDQTTPVLSADQPQVDFTATLKIVRITGRVTLSNGTGVSGVTIATTGTGVTIPSVTTNNQGNYEIPNLPAGISYTVKPSSPFHTFSPDQTTPVLSADQPQVDFTATRTTFNISGKVMLGNGTGVSGVTITAVRTSVGGGTFPATTDNQGNYVIPNLPVNGNYTVEPSLQSSQVYTFSPPNKGFMTLMADETVNFTATRKTFSIIGKVTTTSGARVISLTVSAGASFPATVDSQGNYVISNLPAGGNYIVTPSSPFYTFSPPNKTVMNLTAIETVHFTATLKTFSISGRINDTSGQGVSGVEVSAGPLSAITDGQGNYMIANLPAASTYMVMPMSQLYDFNPQFLPPLGADLKNVDFVAMLKTFTISGQVKLKIGGIIIGGDSGTLITITSPQSGPFSTITDGQGNYSIGNLPAMGNYTVTPSRSFADFSPSNQNFNSLSADQRADFIATDIPINLSPPDPIFSDFGEDQSSASTAALKTFSLSGRVTNIFGLGISGIIVSAGSFSATTDSEGNYRIANLPAGSDYTVTVSSPFFNFSPSSKSVPNLSANQTADFTAMPKLVIQ